MLNLSVWFSLVFAIWAFIISSYAVIKWVNPGIWNRKRVPEIHFLFPYPSYIKLAAFRMPTKVKIYIYKLYIGTEAAAKFCPPFLCIYLSCTPFHDTFCILHHLLWPFLQSRLWRRRLGGIEEDLPIQIWRSSRWKKQVTVVRGVAKTTSLAIFSSPAPMIFRSRGDVMAQGMQCWGQWTGQRRAIGKAAKDLAGLCPPLGLICHHKVAQAHTSHSNCWGFP